MGLGYNTLESLHAVCTLGYRATVLHSCASLLHRDAQVPHSTHPNASTRVTGPRRVHFSFVSRTEFWTPCRTVSLNYRYEVSSRSQPWHREHGTSPTVIIHGVQYFRYERHVKYYFLIFLFESFCLLCSGSNSCWYVAVGRRFE